MVKNLFFIACLIAVKDIMKVMRPSLVMKYKSQKIWNEKSDNLNPTKSLEEEYTKSKKSIRVVMRVEEQQNNESGRRYNKCVRVRELDCNMTEKKNARMMRKENQAQRSKLSGRLLRNGFATGERGDTCVTL